MRKCSTKRCRGEEEITYKGKPLCWNCWEKQCREEKNGETNILPKREKRIQ